MGLPTSRLSLILASGFLCLYACGTGGYLVTEERIALVKIGASTKQEVRNVLGEPRAASASTVSGTSLETWTYAFAKYPGDPYTSVPPIGITSAPISRAHRKTTEIAVSFDKNGIVSRIEESRPAYK